MAQTFDIQALLDESGDRNNPGPEAMKELMESVHTIAVVGISRNPVKPARRVPAYLASRGYTIVPVNPFVHKILGKKAMKSLEEVSDPVDMVLIFRPSDEAAVVAESAMTREERPAIWLQQGIRADEVAARAREMGLTVIQALCAYEIHKALTDG